VRLLDLFCGAGGAAVGYARAGFEVVGVDIAPQPRFPFEFHQADALSFPLEGFDVVHASPPCQAFSKTRAIHGKQYPDLLSPIKSRFLFHVDFAYVIENVVGAPLDAPILLCGEMFGLRVIRHRLFETRPWIASREHPAHRGGTNSHRGYSTGAYYVTVAGHNYRREEGAAAMGIDWPMTRDELSEAIPPAYTEYIGKQLMAALEARDVE
jgi:DNA (cytosine-5)-methyltransferase 1